MAKVNRKVVVAMSGGVDSSVAAALLKEQGFGVVGVHLKFWTQDGKENRCCSTESENRARLVAKKLEIPFYIFNFGKEFKKRVVDYFLEEIKAGRTPNPCVVCNKEIKFGLLLKKALSLEADFIATGHYACLKRVSGRIALLKGKDRNKDQSYFLWQLSQKQLSCVLFPVGGYTKAQVRRLAKKFKLPVAEIPESMEICFAPAGINSFVKRYLKAKPGDIVDTREKVIGRHSGLAYYTIGQRKGIKLPGGPYFVFSKDENRNCLIVTKNKKDLFKKEVIFRDQNWISGKAPKFPIKVMAKIRYGQKAASATIKGKNSAVFLKPQQAVTPGQSVVFYSNSEILGGGVIINK